MYMFLNYFNLFICNNILRLYFNHFFLIFVSVFFHSTSKFKNIRAYCNVKRVV
jgi:hypothetical protein